MTIVVSEPIGDECVCGPDGTPLSIEDVNADKCECGYWGINTVFTDPRILRRMEAHEVIVRYQSEFEALAPGLLARHAAEWKAMTSRLAAQDGPWSEQAKLLERHRAEREAVAPGLFARRKAEIAAIYAE
jgi:hypothetical protein